jgi:hypothetical protein
MAELYRLDEEFNRLSRTSVDKNQTECTTLKNSNVPARKEKAGACQFQPCTHPKNLVVGGLELSL